MQGQEAENPPFPWDELQEIGRKGLPSAGVEAAKTVLFSFVKYATFPVHHMLLIRVQPDDYCLDSVGCCKSNISLAVAAPAAFLCA